MDINPPFSVDVNKGLPAQDSSESHASLLIRDDELFIRMTPIERLQHVVMILCFVLLVLTGLPLLLDPAMWLKRLFFFETSFAWRGWIHRIAGVCELGDQKPTVHPRTTRGAVFESEASRGQQAVSGQGIVPRRQT